MTSFIAFALLISLLAAVTVLMERTNRRTAGLPRAPFGADIEGNADLQRVLHDLDAHRA